MSLVILGIVALLLIVLVFILVLWPNSTQSVNTTGKLSYYLSISDFIQSFIQIPTTNVTNPSSTIQSSYLAGRAPLYNSIDNLKVGTCSASFLNMKTEDGGIFTDIANYIQTDAGFIITWFTPTRLVNLELDSIINGMVTEAIVTVTTKVGASPFYGKSYNMIVSSDGQYIHFDLTPR
jgi:hypothetical protein